MSILIIGSKGTLGGEFMRQTKNAVGWDLEDIDITKKEEMQKIYDLHPDLIINCSAYNAVDRAEEDKKTAMNVNGYGVGHLAEAANNLNTIFVHYSTDFVFDGEAPDGYKENDKPNPQSVYAESKYLGEQLVFKNAKKFYIIRLTGLFGKCGAGHCPGETSKKSFVEARIEDSKIKDKLAIVDDEFTSPTYAPDLVKRTFYIFENFLPYGIYHGNNSGVCSWYEFTKKIFEIMDIKTEVIPISGDKLERPAKRPKKAMLLNTKLPPARHWQDALREFLNNEYGTFNNNS